jgi:hypothetical protein
MNLMYYKTSLTPSYKIKSIFPYSYIKEENSIAKIRMNSHKLHIEMGVG